MRIAVFPIADVGFTPRIAAKNIIAAAFARIIVDGDYSSGPMSGKVYAARDAPIEAYSVADGEFTCHFNSR